jgi:hypothetical protein
MRLEGNYTWYLLDTDRNVEELTAVIEGGPPSFDGSMVGIDFHALQVAFGAPMQLDTLVGLDGPGNVVGAAGVHLGGGHEMKRRQRANGPVPDFPSHEYWIPAFFCRLAKAMVEKPDLPWGVACTNYLDSISNETIDGRYLKLHVALEAFARALLKADEGKKKTPPRLLVKSGETWRAWVEKHRTELFDMLVDPKQEKVFVGKVVSAMNLPSSGIVADALSRLDPPLRVDETVLAELEMRNIPAHHLRMNKPDIDYEVDRDVERVDMLRTLFVALIARATGYEGPISGWARDAATETRPHPAWWPAPSPAALLEAQVAFACEREQQPYRSPRPRRFQSRLLKRPMGKR